MAQAWPGEARYVPVILPYRAGCAASLVDGHVGDGRLRVRALSGEEELAIDDALADGCAALEIASMLIGACAADAQGPIGAAAADDLSLGDREVLLRAVYAATFARTIDAQTPCRAGCGETIAFSVDLAMLDQAPPESGPIHRVRLGGREFSCRVPIGSDLRRSLRSPGHQADAIARACTEGALMASEDLASALAEFDPNAECTISLACPQCGVASTVWIDAFELIRCSVLDGGGITFQIDRLARAYGWSEASILALPRARRQRYCALDAAKNAV